MAKPLRMLVLMLTVFLVGYLNPTAAALVLEYKFENSGKSFVRDTSGNRLHGTIKGSGGNGYHGVGFSAKSLKLNGRDGYVLVPDRSIFDFKAFTISTWVRIQNSTWDRQEVVEKAGAFWVNVRKGTRKVRAGGRFGGCAVKPHGIHFDSDRAVPLNTWTHIAVTFDGTQLKTFINGEPAGSARVPTPGRVCANTEPLAVGAKHKLALPKFTGAFFKGHMDLFRIYDKALSAKEISKLIFRR